MLADYISDVSVQGIKKFDLPKLEQEAKELMVNDGISDELRFKSIIELYIESGLHVYSPGSLGRQYTGNIPLSAITDMVNSVVNQPSSFYEASPLPCVAEKLMAEELNRFLGFDKDEFAMFSTSGGSLANLTALLSARNTRYAACRSKGMAYVGKSSIPSVAMSQDAHYSLIRSLEMIGIGRDNIVWLPLNKNRQIDIGKVSDTINKAKKNGSDVFCIVASAGSTPTGAIDPIKELASIAHTLGLWLHVDGCHGASFLVSEKLSHKLAGICEADSISWDAHKMLSVPSPCSLLFYKDRKKALNTFGKPASYVATDSGCEYGAGEMNFECTKRASIMNLWILWSLYGRNYFACKVERMHEACQEAYEVLKSQPDFATIHKPETNILCFRYIPGKIPAGVSMSDFQCIIRHKVCEQGRFFISKVFLDGCNALRVVFMNHKHTLDNFMELLSEIRAIGHDFKQ